MAKRKADELLPVVEELLARLRQLREQGDYPPALGHLFELSAIVEEAHRERILKHKVFRDQVLVARAGDLAAPTGLKEDLALLARSESLLIYLLESLSTERDWKWPVAKLAAKLVPALKKLFQTEMESRLANGVLPSTVGALSIKNKPHLFLRRLIPAEAKQLLIAEALAVKLREFRTRGNYPLSLEQLGHSLSESVDSNLLHQASKEPPFKSQVLLSLPNNLAAPLALSEDVEQLAGSPTLLKFLVESLEKSDHHGHALKDLKKPLAKPLQSAFEQALVSHTTQGTLPPDFGWLRINKQIFLFFLRHVNDGQLTLGPMSVSPSLPTHPQRDFATTFADAFDRLDRQSGSHNFVSLVDLRRAIPSDRESFDTELLRLRQAGLFALSAAEGRHGINPDQQQAGIVEEGSLLLFVSKKR